ncbi:hypothetical protein EW146_g8231 [Bondarzewia mesenterica]|uniref:Uncharacterized protein n=1 Tax=Bondarzewia mesenterica TaxID=1095465 RepID=A0A4S4LGN8_9AGAM|nr:hypothetical protein EW146_g8231 [Bondarzewia mesenterica]
MKARQAVRISRLELDAAKQTLKNVSPSRQEHARLEVENAEDDLVQKTEVAITLMKAVLDNPRTAQGPQRARKGPSTPPSLRLHPISTSSSLLLSFPRTLTYHAAAAEALATAQGEIEELSVAAEGEYRYVGTELFRSLFVSPPVATLPLPFSRNTLTSNAPRKSRDH